MKLSDEREGKAHISKRRAITVLCRMMARRTFERKRKACGQWTVESDFCAQFLTGHKIPTDDSHKIIRNSPCLALGWSSLTSRYAFSSVDCITIGSSVAGIELCLPFREEPPLKARLIVELGYGIFVGPTQCGESKSASPDKYFSFEPVPLHFSEAKTGQSDCADELKTPRSKPSVAIS